MKLLKTIIPAGLALATALAFTSCDTPSYPETNVKAGYVNTSLDAYSTPYDSVSVNTVDVNLDSDFIRGFDASAVDEIEEDGGLWYTDDCVNQDFFKILKKNGVNTIRLRIWNDPETFVTTYNASKESSEPVYSLDGSCDLERTVRTAKRAKAAGLKVYLDFHYSDTWADPSKQVVPLAWQSLTSVDEVAQAVYDFTFSVMDAMNAAGATPDYVQLGNEISGNGILLHTGLTYVSSSESYNGSDTFAYAGNKTNGASSNLVKYLNSGAKAVRLTAPEAKIILHFASSTTGALSTACSNVDYDIIGLSYYPNLNSHGTISALKANIKNYKTTYGKDVIIAETSWDYDESGYSAKSAAAYSNLCDPDTSAVYTDLTTNSGDNGNWVECSLQNQVNVIRHVIEESADAGAVGVCVWGGELKDWHAMFDWQGVALPSLAVFNVQGK